MLKPDKKTMVVSAGAGLGVVQTIWSKQWGLFPGASGILPSPWDRWSTLGNILIGGIVFGVTTFTKILSKKHKFINTALQVYGITAVIGGLVNGVFETTIGFRRAGLTAGVPNGYFTSTYYPDVTGTFYRRPQSPAKGFGSDVTKNPMAAIPTTIGYEKIIF